MRFKPMRWLLLALVAVASGALAQNNFNTLDKGGIQVLCKSAVAVSAPADTSEDTLATCSVPANAMGANGIVRVSAVFSETNSANAKTARIRFSGASGTTYFSGPLTSLASAEIGIVIANRNATNSQVGVQRGSASNSGTFAVSTSTSAIDTTAATSLVITCQKATGSETCTLEFFLVELMPSN